MNVFYADDLEFLGSAVQAAGVVTIDKLHQSEHDESHDLEQLTEDMLLQLQSEELPLEQYCHAVITHATPLMMSYMNKDFPSSRKDTNDHRLPTAYMAVCLQLLFTTTDLLDTLREGQITIREQKNAMVCHCT